MTNTALHQPPPFCQYSGGACDQTFVDVPASHSVVLYPSEPEPIATAIERAVALVKEDNRSKPWLTWRDFRVTGQVIFCAICKRMRTARTVVADVTTLNFNVLFEIGFALGLELPVLLIRDSTFLKDKRDFDELGLLDTIGYADFQNADGLATSFREKLPIGAIPAPPAEVNRESPIYVIKEPLGTEGQVTLLSALKKSSLRFRTYDPLEEPRLSLHEGRKQVASSLAVVAHLLSPERKGSRIHNARAALLAGMAAGSQKTVLLVQEGAYPQPIDYREIVVPYTNPDLIPKVLDNLVRRVIGRLQDAFVPSIRTPQGLLEQVDLGDVAAENEIGQLRSYFVRTGQFQEARRGHARLVVGRKGAGKTAIFYGVRHALPKTSSHLVLDMKPEGHQFTKLRETILARLTPGLQEYLLTAFWNYLLLCEIAHKVVEQDYSWAQRDEDRHRKFLALSDAYRLEQPHDTGDLSERLMRQIDRLATQFSQVGEGASPGQLTQVLFRKSIPTLEALVSDYLTDKEEVWLLVDNLDKGWPTRGASSEDVLLLRTLLEATRKLERQLEQRGVDFFVLVFLRNDIYEHLVRDTPDKGKDTAITLDWDDEEMFKQVLHQRILATGQGQLKGDFRAVWEALFEPYVDTQESFRFVVSRTLMRPRDLLRFVHKAIEVAINRGHRVVTAADLLKAEAAYSEDMLRGLSFELGDVNPALVDAVYHFIGCPSVMPQDDVRTRLVEGGVPAVDVQSTLEHLLWFGYLGVQDSGRDGLPVYSYQVGYNLAKLLAGLQGGAEG